MSSRNSFTTSYIYNEEAVEWIADQMATMGYGIQPSGGQYCTQVVGMMKNIEYTDKSRLDNIRSVLKNAKKKFDINYPISIVFIGDEQPVVTFITTDPKHKFRDSVQSDLDIDVPKYP